MYPFAYHSAETLEEAATLLGMDGEGKVVAGGQTLLPTLKQRLARPSHLVDLGRVRELVGFAAEGSVLTIRAMTCHRDVAASKDVREAIPSLAALAAGIGDPAVRHRGTIGGSIANNDPSADYPAACLALDATIVTTSREIPADEFFTGLFETALNADEIITAIRFRTPDFGRYVKFRSPASRYAIAGVYVARFGGAVRVAVTGVAQGGVFRWREAEAALAKQFGPGVLRDLPCADQEFMNDVHADAAYREHLMRTLAARTVEDN